jgi:hypothetical protein
MKTYLKSKRFLLIVGLLVLNGLFFSITNPDHINSGMLIVGFIFLGVTIYAFMELFLYLISRAGVKIKNRRRLAIFLAILFSVLLALQSIGQLSSRDILVIIPLWLMFYIYLTHIRPRVYV